MGKEKNRKNCFIPKLIDLIPGSGLVTYTNRNAHAYLNGDARSHILAPEFLGGAGVLVVYNAVLFGVTIAETIERFQGLDKLVN